MASQGLPFCRIQRCCANAYLDCRREEMPGSTAAHLGQFLARPAALASSALGPTRTRMPAIFPDYLVPIVRNAPEGVTGQYDKMAIACNQA
jgi:hypothetical protein